MIINYPTALYRPILPDSGESGNISYTISTQSPPKSGELFLQLPIDQEIRKSEERIYTKQQKRSFIGNLIFDIIKPGKSIEGSGSKQFEIGQVLDFTETDIESSDPYNLEQIELRQDTSVVDYERYGMTKDEYNELLGMSRIKMDDLTKQINNVGTQINDAQDKLRLNQSDINQSTKLYNNIVTVLGSSHQSAIKLQNVINNLKNDRIKLQESLNNYQNELQILRDELQRVREVVR